MTLQKKYSLSIPLILFCICFAFIPLRLLHGLELMPGDIGDARLNNYFLENVYLFATGQSESIWHLPFFYPFPWVLGFSDNHFGSAIFYILARLTGCPEDTSFQIWFLVGYAINFIAAYYALRKFDMSTLAASIGALIFTFSLPTVAHCNHAQLHYRFGIPLAITFYIFFLNEKNWRFFFISFAWLVWQFFSGIYMGFFTLLLMGAMSIAYLIYVIVIKKQSVRALLSSYRNVWRSKKKRDKAFILGCGLLLLVLLLVLFYPYLQVTHLYGAKRHWGEISLMLPRPQSYLLSDASLLWGDLSKTFSNIPVRHEHQMFIGLVPLLLALAGLCVGSTKKNGLTYVLMGGMCACTVLLTLYIGKYSLWFLLYKLPLASAIRAMTRFDQALLFPIAYFAALAVDCLRKRGNIAKIFLLAVIAMFAFEAGMTRMSTSNKSVWRERISAIESIVPENLPDNAVLFFAQQSSLEFAHELDAMWVSLKRKRYTMNGYSGLYPAGCRYSYGTHPFEIESRLNAYLRFIGQEDNEDIRRQLKSQIIPIGFVAPVLHPNKLHKTTIGTDGYRYLGGGWSGPEDWGTWSNAKTAQIDFHVVKALPSQLEMDLNVFLAANHKVQRMIPSLNGVPLTEFTLSKGQEMITLDISKAVKQGHNSLVIELPDAISPKELGISGDARTLAIGLKSLRFEQAAQQQDTRQTAE